MHSFSIGTISGIDLRVHPTLALAGLWVAYEYGYVANDGASGVLYGLILLMIILGCVVLHELGHSLMGREFGAATREITIYPLGGAAYIERMPVEPKREAAITIAGPLVNLAIAFCILPLVVAAGVVAGHSSVDEFVLGATEPTLVGLLVSVLLFNILNVLFNLIPAFPMDGGRLVRAGLTAILGREAATNIAVTFGYVIAGAMIVIGIWIEQLTLPLIGLFVMYLAYAEGKGVRIEAMMRRIRVGQFALWEGGGISATDPLKVALAGGPSDIAVVTDGRVVGMLWRRDLLAAIRAGASARPVGELMDRHIVTVETSATVHEAHSLMEQTNRWAIPVVEDGVYRGLFTSDRLMHVYRLVGTQTSYRRRLMQVWTTMNGRVRGLPDVS